MKSIFEVITKNEIFQQFDTSHNFWSKFNVQNEKTRKQLKFQLLNTTTTFLTIIFSSYSVGNLSCASSLLETSGSHR